MPTMKIEMTIPELQSFIATNRKVISDLEDSVSYYKLNLKCLYQWTSDNIDVEDHTYQAENCANFIKEDKQKLKQHRRDLAHYVKLQIAAKKALRKAYEDERKRVEEHKKNAAKFFNVIVC